MAHDEHSAAAIVVDRPPNAAACLETMTGLGLSGSDAEAVAASMSWWKYRAGDYLFRDGDEADALFVIASGRLRVLRDDLATDLSVGAVVGEAGLLLGGFRSADIAAVRDTVVGRLGQAEFERAVERVPTLGLALARTVSRYLQAGTHRPPAMATVVVAVGSLGRETSYDPVAQLVAALRREHADRAVAHITPQSISDPKTRELVDDADLVVVVASAEDRPGLEPLERSWRCFADRRLGNRMELVLVHPQFREHPVDTASWLALATFARHHHIRRGSSRDVERAARRVSRTGTSLVLGGGGARGLAHIGVLQALEELAVPVDDIGGSSMGAIMGALASQGTDAATMLETTAKALMHGRLQRDVAAPTVSLLRGRTLLRLFVDAFGERRIEDLWTGYFCTTVNLTRGELEIHTAGPVRCFALASGCVPGLFPPVVDSRGELHSDGGQLNNLPADVMRTTAGGTIVAVDVSLRGDPIRFEPAYHNRVGLGALVDGLRGRPRLPALGESLQRSMLVPSNSHRERVAAEIDVLLEPPVSAYSLMAFGRVREIAQLGHAYARERLGAAVDSRQLHQRPVAPSGQ